MVCMHWTSSTKELWMPLSPPLWLREDLAHAGEVATRAGPSPRQLKWQDDPRFEGEQVFKCRHQSWALMARSRGAC